MKIANETAQRIVSVVLTSPGFSERGQDQSPFNRPCRLGTFQSLCRCLGGVRATGETDESLTGANGGVAVGVKERVQREFDSAWVVVSAERAGCSAANCRLLVPGRAREPLRYELAAHLSQGLGCGAPHRCGRVVEQRLEQTTRDDRL
jgi:hypothetical protein